MKKNKFEKDELKIESKEKIIFLVYIITWMIIVYKLN